MFVCINAYSIPMKCSSILSIAIIACIALAATDVGGYFNV